MTVRYGGYVNGQHVFGMLENLHRDTTDLEIYNILLELGISNPYIIDKQ